MRRRKNIFSFNRYKLLRNRREVHFTYTSRNQEGRAYRFTHTLLLPKKIPTTAPKELIEKELQMLHLMCGVSYYKVFANKHIKYPYKLTEGEANFWTTIYTEGLGEFWYRNKLNIEDAPVFTSHKKGTAQPAVFPRSNRSLVGIGGGKDSTLTVELLKEAQTTITGLIIETEHTDHHARAMTKAGGINELTIKQKLDPQLLRGIPGSYNGHIPISAVWAAIGLFAATIYDYRYVITGNEYTSNSKNLTYQGLDINHQWSKSQRFESLFKDYVRSYITYDISYFSLLRPFTELRIAKHFSTYERYLSQFTSCNKNFRIEKVRRPETRWCKTCAKCAFTFLMLSAWLPKTTVVNIFGHDLLADESLEKTYSELLGFSGKKPFDCVGTFEESKAALYLTHKRRKKGHNIEAFIDQITDGKKLVEESLRTHEAPTLPEPFIFAGIESVLLLGYGVEGKATKAWLNAKYPKIKVSHTETDEKGLHRKKQYAADLTIKSPGVPKRHIISHYTTATNIFLAEKRDQVIGITGTKGKSTTAHLTHHILKRAHKDVRLVGNIGNPMISELLKKNTRETIYIAELSSYQLDDAHYAPHVAVITNLYEDHLPYHGDKAAYHKAKQNIIAHQTRRDYWYYNGKDKTIRTWLGTSKSIPLDISKKYITYDISETLPGEHNLTNAKAAVAIAKRFSVSNSIIKEALLSYKGLPHRLENLGTHNMITFYDDALSTTPASTIAALKTLGSVDTIFLGGEDRGYDFTELRKALKRHNVRNVVLFPDTGKRILSSEAGYNTLHTKSMKEAVTFALKHTTPEKICLLSTASPSFSIWKDYKEKAAEYRKWIKELTKPRK